MLTIYVPHTFFEERKYIVDIIISQFLGMDYELIKHDSRDYKIVLENKNTLIISDHFFSKVCGPTYLSPKYLPQNIRYASNPYIVEDDIPIIYGDADLITTPRKINCNIDIFSSSFFMLARWEEYVNKNRDMHGRFPARESVAYKFGFLHRPVVNEYIEMLWNMLVSLGIKQNRKKRSLRVCLTHDVDTPYYWNSVIHFLRVFSSMALKSRSVTKQINLIQDLIRIKQNKKKDPYDTFEYLMESAESIGIAAHFYFMAGRTCGFDGNYDINDKKIAALISSIKDRGHIIGFHPSYNTFNDSERWKKEKLLLENFIGSNLCIGRQHYLRFEVPTTWQIWEDNSMQIDSTCCYADREGFRCGTGDDYNVFNILTRKKLELRERPLLFMDDGRYPDSIREESAVEDIVSDIIAKCKKYKMHCTLLFHNSIFSVTYMDFRRIYDRQVIDRFTQNNKTSDILQ